MMLGERKEDYGIYKRVAFFVLIGLFTVGAMVSKEASRRRSDVDVDLNEITARDRDFLSLTIAEGGG